MKALPSMTSTIMLFIAFLDMPYVYYQLLRWVICGTCASYAFNYYEKEKLPLTWIFGITAFIYTPVGSFHLGRETWTVINVLTIILLIGNLIYNKTQE